MNSTPNLPYEFTVDWFSNNIPAWKELFKHHKNRPVKWLEIGTYEGRSALWAVEHVLKHTDSSITCVDTWDDPKVFSTFKKNIKHAPKEKITYIKSSSRDALKKPALIKRGAQFDVVYIDADHHSSSVLEDAILAFPLLKPGGLMIFDDYTYSKERDNRCPKQGIDAFLNAFAQHVHVKSARWQVVVQKLEKPRRKEKCMSEYYA